MWAVRRRLDLTIAMLVFGLATALVAVLTVAHNGPVENGTAYAVARVQDGLLHHPQQWLGRIVWVRGWVPPVSIPIGGSSSTASQGSNAYVLEAVSGPSPSPLSSSLAQMGVSTVVDPGRALLLVAGPEDRILGAWRHIPLIDRLVPSAQVPLFLSEATYRVQFRAAPATMICPTGPCYEAVLLDAGPWPTPEAAVVRALLKGGPPGSLPGRTGLGLETPPAQVRGGSTQNSLPSGSASTTHGTVP